MEWEIFDRNRVGQLFGLSWGDKLSNSELMMRAVLTALKEVIVGCWRRWLGHVLSKGRGRLSRRLLAYDTLELGVKIRGSTTVMEAGGCKGTLGMYSC